MLLAAKRIGLVLLLACSALAEDERRVASPNGQLEMRVFVTTQETSNLSRLAYQIFYRGKPLLKTSYLGLDIEDQEPLLGENVGLTSSSMSKGPNYNSLIAKYMQDGSIGRLIDIESRAYDDHIEFRYVIPRSTPLLELDIVEEATEFSFAGEPVAISESNGDRFPHMRLVSEDASTKLTRLDGKFHGTTPWTGPWRIVSVGEPKSR